MIEHVLWIGSDWEQFRLQLPYPRQASRLVSEYDLSQYTGILTQDGEEILEPTNRTRSSDAVNVVGLLQH